MTDLRKAAEMALEYLEYLNELDIVGLDHEIQSEAIRQALAQPEQEPVHFLANGVRYKVTHQGYYGCSIVGLPENLNGQWVALVEATDSKHLNCIAHQESTKPEPVVEPANSATNFVESKHFAQPEQEPVAWLHPDKKVDVVVPSKLAWFDKPIPLYTAPPKREWVGLTDEERVQAFVDAGLELAYMDYDADMKISNAIEAKLKEKNHG